MARLTKFTLSPSGELVYRSTGKLAPASYTYKNQTVYGPNGRRIGSLAKKLTKTEQARIAKAEQNRRKRSGASGKPRKPSAKRPKAPSKNAKSQKFGENWEQFDSEDFPEPAAAVKEEFAQRVRDCAASVAPPWLQKRIRAFSTDALWKAYQEDQYIFEVYFQYHTPSDPPHKSNVSEWLYQFVSRIESIL